MNDTDATLSTELPRIANALETLLRLVTGVDRLPFVLLVANDKSVQYTANVARDDGMRMISGLLARWGTEGTPDIAEHQTVDFVTRLLAQCRAYHEALDLSFAMLAEVTRGQPSEPFFPSKSPMWNAVASGKALMDEVDAALALSEELSRTGSIAPPPPGERH